MYRNTLAPTPSFRPLCDSDRNVLAELRYEGQIQCPECGHWSPEDHNRCEHCGEFFPDEDDDS